MFVKDNSALAVKKYIVEQLESRYGQREANNIANCLFFDLFDWTRTDLITQDNLRLTESQLLEVRSAVKRMKTGEPLQYVTGKAWFGDLELNVNRDVLIPRPETEEWLMHVIEQLEGTEKTIDLGTGSGCIPLLLKRHLPNLNISAMDVSGEAIDVAKLNAEAHDLDVNFFTDDLLGPSAKMNDKRWDVIISNPPYIAMEEARAMEPHVLDHEPHLALFIEGDPLIFYRAIADYAKVTLKKGGKLFVEINEAFPKEVVQILENTLDGTTYIFEDLQGKSRMVAIITSS